MPGVIRNWLEQAGAGPVLIPIAVDSRKETITRRETGVIAS
jgi:hypothetical protein